MTGWAAKRFWTTAFATACDGGYTVQLDGRRVKTPAKAALILPSLTMATSIAAEWQAQDKLIRPETMPMARYAHSAIDKVIPQFDAVVAIVAAYGASDLLCYRAAEPAELRARQDAGWDPVLDWAAGALGARLFVTTGVMPLAQDADALGTLTAAVAAHSPFQLAAFHDLVAITGSLILGFAIARGHHAPDEAFALSRIDETYQAELWGRDEDAAATESLKQRGLADAAAFFRSCG